MEKTIDDSPPEIHKRTFELEDGFANCCRFNRWGTILAVGTTMGEVYLLDFITKDISKVLMAHCGPITALSWSRDGRKLLTAAADTTITVWDVLTSRSIQKFKYPSIVIQAFFNPRNDLQIVVLSMGMFPLSEVFLPNGEIEHGVFSCDIPGVPDEVTTIAFDHRGKYLLAGSGKGRIYIFDAITLCLVAHVRQNSLAQIKSIVFSRHEYQVLTITADRLIRCFDMKDLLTLPPGSQINHKQKFFDSVGKDPWRAICVSPGGNYICGGSAKSHSLHIWELDSGAFVKILNGPNLQIELIHDLQWHPTQPIVLSVANGILNMWIKAQIENYVAYAPEFISELIANVNYAEKESEFDKEDEDADEKKDDAEQETKQIIDICGLKASDIICSSDEEADPSRLLPDPTYLVGALWTLPMIHNIETLSGIRLYNKDLLCSNHKQGSKE